jgi:hypothetical protein
VTLWWWVSPSLHKTYSKQTNKILDSVWAESCWVEMYSFFLRLQSPKANQINRALISSKQRRVMALKFYIYLFIQKGLQFTMLQIIIKKYG